MIGSKRIRLHGAAITALRRECYERDGHRCQLCGLLLSWDDMHMDHDPVSRGQGGSDVIGNVRCLCQTCHIQSPYSKHQ